MLSNLEGKILNRKNGVTVYQEKYKVLDLRKVDLLE